MTDRKELETLAAEMRKRGAAVTIDHDMDGHISDITILWAKGIGPYPMPAISAAERMREYINRNPLPAEPTPAPWEFKAQGDANQYCIITKEGKWVLGVIHNGEALESQQIANMQHMVSCVNSHDAYMDVLMVTQRTVEDMIYNLPLSERKQKRDGLVKWLQSVNSAIAQY